MLFRSAAAAGRERRAGRHNQGGTEREDRDGKKEKMSGGEREERRDKVSDATRTMIVRGINSVSRVHAPLVHHATVLALHELFELALPF